MFVSRKPSPRMVRQEQEQSCGPACCRQLLRDRGIDAAEERLYALARCTPGTKIDAKVLAIMLNAVIGSEEYTGGGVDPADLPKLMARAPFLALLKFGSEHWVIVDGLTGLLVQLRDPAETSADPATGTEATMRIERFHEHWRLAIHAVVFRK